MLDGAGVCCESGVLDDCGVCDGDHASCSKVILLDILLPDLTGAASLTTPAVQQAFRYVSVAMLGSLVARLRESESDSRGGRTPNCN